MSVKGRIVTDMIRFFTAQKMLGPKIQDGTLRKNLVEAPWHCPEEYINLPIPMRQFEMERLVQVLKAASSSFCCFRCHIWERQRGCHHCHTQDNGHCFFS